MSHPFMDAGRYDVAFQMILDLTTKSPGIGLFDPEFKIVECLKKSKGEEEALAWTRKNLTPAIALEFASTAFKQREFDLVWLPEPSSMKESDVDSLWQLRALAAAVRGFPDRAQKKLLTDHYSLVSDKDPECHYWRYLLGLESDSDLFALATDGRHRSEIAFTRGVKAFGERRFLDASQWLLVPVKLHEKGWSGDRARTVLEWLVSRNKALDVLMADKTF